MIRSASRRIAPLLAALVLIACTAASAQTFVRLTTDAGDVLLVMAPEKAPNHVANFTALGAKGFYTGTTFHRVIPGFMIQGGDPLSKDDNRANDGTGGPSWADVLDADDFAALEALRAKLDARGFAGIPAEAAIKAEFNDTSHLRGVLSMARSRDPNSGGSQFFICVADAPHLDNKYTAFGRTVTGFDVIDAIVESPRDRNDNPKEPVAITGFTVIEGLDGLTAEEREAWEAADVSASAGE